MDAPHRDNAPDLAPHDDATAKKGPRPRSGLKTFLVVLVIVFFQVDFVLFMLWADKTGIFGKPPPVEKSIEECRAEISAMDDDARISFVLNHDAYHEQVIASRLLGRNFICRLKQNKDEELYDRAKKFVDSWAGYADLVPPQYGVEFFLVNEKDVGIWQERLDKIYKNTLSEEQEKKENFMISMFMFRQDGICADGDWADWVADACRALDGSRSGRRTCNTFCDKLDIYQNNETAFRNEVLEFSGCRQERICWSPLICH